ncbi:MAG TPA: D-alanyl-D-alanine carboxypeptidase family protein [Solirubrobacteraceae bacterium]|nr:D-alanyl-D-alanine carboxypeptidase family protein [Solirubrobacteraceae bacterium]
MDTRPGTVRRRLSRGLSALLGAFVLAGMLGSVPAQAASPPRLTARAAALYAPATGQFLFTEHPGDELAVASTTKLMTALIVLEHVRDLGTVFTQNNYYPAAGDSQIGLVPGERMTVRDLLTAMMLPSGDDAAEDLAYNVGHGSIARFVAMMNARARQLGLTATHYSTPVGLDTPGNHSSAADLDRLAAYDLAHSRAFAHMVAQPRAVLQSGSHVRVVANLNNLVSEYPWIDGVKTGHTRAAGYVLVASARRFGLRLISSVLGTTSEASRDANSLALLDWGYASFRLRTPLRRGQVLARPAVQDQPGLHPRLVAARGLRRVVGITQRVALRIRAPRQISGPLQRGAALGTATVLVAGRPVARIPLVLSAAVPAVPPLVAAGQFLTRPLSLIVLIMLVGIAGAVVLNARQRRRSRSRRRELEAA